MKRSANLTLFYVLFIAAAVIAASAQAQPSGTTKRGEEVIATIAKWAEAVRDRDVRALESIFDDEVIITTFDGNTRGKAGELEAMKPNPNVRGVSVANEDVAIKLFGDVAVVTALTKMKIVAANGRESRIAMRYTAVLAKKDGAWRIVALQTARAPQAAGG